MKPETPKAESAVTSLTLNWPVFALGSLSVQYGCTELWSYGAMEVDVEP